MGKYVEGSGGGLMGGAVPGNVHGGTHKYHGQDSLSPGRDRAPHCPEYKAEVLAT